MVRVAVSLITFGLKQAISIVRFAAPHAIRLVLFTLGVSFQLSALGAIAVVKGIPKVAEKIADDWTHRAIESGFPYLWEIYLRNIFFVLGICTICLGWLLVLFIAFFTVQVARNLLT